MSTSFLEGIEKQQFPNMEDLKMEKILKPGAGMDSMLHVPACYWIDEDLVRRICVPDRLTVEGSKISVWDYVISYS